MPTISYFLSLRIMMYWDDHNPPHFHVRADDGRKGVFNIQTLEMIEGEFKRKTQALILDWAELHQTELLVDWELCKKQQAPNPIAPLE